MYRLERRLKTLEALTPAATLPKIWELLTEAGLRAKSGENRFTDRGETISPLQTTDSIAKDMGVTARTVQQEKQIARDILPEKPGSV